MIVTWCANFILLFILISEFELTQLPFFLHDKMMALVHFVRHAA